MYKETGKWVNYGDVNFLEYGGCMVKKAYSKEEIDKYATLDSIYDVFYVYIEEKPEIVALCTVDINDSWINTEDILYAIGLEDKKDIKYGGLTPLMFAKECVEYYGVENFSPIFYNNKRNTSFEELIDWMVKLEIIETV